MPRVLALLLLTLATLSTAANAAPRIEVVGGDTVDLGRGRPGLLLRQIAITNTGSDPLRILELNSGCGCLIGRLESDMIAPGDTAVMTMTVETSGQVAESWRRTLTIRSNDPQRPTVDLLVTALFRHDLRLRTLINTIERTRCAPCRWTVEIENIGDTAIVIGTPVVEEIRGATVEIAQRTPRTIAPGEVHIIEAVVRTTGTDDFPLVRLLLISSSPWDPETRTAWFHAPEP